VALKFSPFFRGEAASLWDLRNKTTPKWSTAMVSAAASGH